jgi:hypothetical protein
MDRAIEEAAMDRLQAAAGVFPGHVAPHCPGIGVQLAADVPLSFDDVVMSEFFVVSLVSPTLPQVISSYMPAGG